METVRQAVASVRSMWAALSVNQRVVLILLLGALGVLTGWGVSATGQGPDHLLVGPETPADVQRQVLARLDEMRVPYRVRGGSIYVPAEGADETWVRIQGELEGDLKAPEGSLFDFSFNNDEQKQIREQKRVERLLRFIPEIRRVGVELRKPSGPGMRDQKVEGSAVVAVDLRPGVTMTPKLLKAIAHVAARPAGISPSHVTVLSGGAVYRPGGDEAGSVDSLWETAFDMERRIAEHLTNHLRPLGYDVSVMASIRLSAKQTRERTETVGRPVPSEEETSRTSDGQKTDSRTVLRNIVPRGEIETLIPRGTELLSLTVSVIIAEQADVPMNDDFKGKVREIVLKATGITDENSVSVQTMPRIVATAAVAAPEREPSLIPPQAGPAGLVVVTLLLFWMLYRVTRGAFGRSAGVTVEDSAGAGGAVAPGAVPQEVEAARLRAGVSESAMRDPQGAAEWVRRLIRR